MAVEQLAATHYREQVAVGEQAAAAAGELWAGVEPARIAGSWLERVPLLARLLGLAQTRAAGAADGYVDAVAAESGVPGGAAGRVVPAALAGVASDGRPLDSLLYQPVVRALTLIGDGAPVARALLVARIDLDMITRTQVADAGRIADGVAVTARPALTGYVRMLSPPSCSRCIVLAGRKYRWNQGFARHPRCDCRHIPAAEDSADDARTRSRAYFAGLTEAEQDRVFGRAGAAAIRGGADMSRVVNARRGMTTAADGRLYTTEATTRRGRLPGQNRGPRLMPEQIYAEARGDRDEAIRLLRLHGYIL